QTMEKRRTAGRRLLFWGAVTLMALSGYEFWIRLDVIWWAIEGLWRLSRETALPFARALSFYDPSMFYLVGFLGTVMLYALAAILLRNRALASYPLLLGAAAIGLTGGFRFGMFNFSLLNWVAGAKLVPLTAIAAGCACNIAQYHVGRSRGRKGWNDVYEQTGATGGGPRGDDVRARVRDRRRSKRRQEMGA
ncbi:MAG: hypothetical protein VB067_03875, partial [Christensenellaceae bacterium]|nr:hypothetical protein [Christensenellaceae bacterium]